MAKANLGVYEGIEVGEVGKLSDIKELTDFPHGFWLDIQTGLLHPVSFHEHHATFISIINKRNGTDYNILDYRPDIFEHKINFVHVRFNFGSEQAELTYCFDIERQFYYSDEKGGMIFVPFETKLTMKRLYEKFVRLAMRSGRYSKDQLSFAVLSGITNKVAAVGDSKTWNSGDYERLYSYNEFIEFLEHNNVFFQKPIVTTNVVVNNNEV